MKNVWIIAVVGLLLTGCAAQNDLETVQDSCQLHQEAESFQLQLTLPEEASAASMSADDGSIYHCDDYSIAVQKLPGGDIEKTILELTGMSLDRLTVLKLQKDGKSAYRFAWSAVGEGTLESCSCMVLDDGAYHHAVTVMGDYRKVNSLHNEWLSIFDSINLVNTG